MNENDSREADARNPGLALWTSYTHGFNGALYDWMGRYPWVALVFALQAVVLLIWAAIPWSWFSSPSGNGLHSELASVQRALDGLSGLESSLERARAEINNVSAELQRMEAEREHAARLTALSAEQIEAVRAELMKSSWYEKLARHTTGFISGALASLAASFWFAWIRLRRVQRRARESDAR